MVSLDTNYHVLINLFHSNSVTLPSFHLFFIICSTFNIEKKIIKEYLLSTYHVPDTTGCCENAALPNKEGIQFYGLNMQIIMAKLLIVLYAKTLNFKVPCAFLRAPLKSFIGAPEQVCPCSYPFILSSNSFM